jgi:hypothetical protein
MTAILGRFREPSRKFILGFAETLPHTFPARLEDLLRGLQELSYVLEFIIEFIATAEAAMCYLSEGRFVDEAAALANAHLNLLDRSKRFRNTIVPATLNSNTPRSVVQAYGRAEANTASGGAAWRAHMGLVTLIIKANSDLNADPTCYPPLTWLQVLERFKPDAPQ